MKQLYTILGYLATPLMLGLNYYYDEPAWLYLYSLMCVGLIIFLALGTLGVMLVVKELDPKGVHSLVDSTKDITGWQRIVGYFYGIASFLYLAFTHHYVIATLSIVTSVIAWVFVAILMHEIKQFKVKL